MKLEGKLKDDCLTWIWQKHFNTMSFTLFNHRWVNIPQSAQFGLIQEFADSIKIIIEMRVHVNPTMSGRGSLKSFKPVILFEGRFIDLLATYAERGKAQIRAIKKLNEIYNEN